jgi:hypothetical protein
MYGQVEAAGCGALAKAEDLCGIQSQKSAVGWAAFVWLEHGGGLRTQGAVGEQLEWAEAQPVIPHTAGLSQVKRVGQVIALDGFNHAELELAGLLERYQRQVAFVAVKIVHAGQAQA